MISPTLEVVKAFQSVITKEKEEEVGAKTNIHFGSLRIWKRMLGMVRMFLKVMLI